MLLPALPSSHQLREKKREEEDEQVSFSYRENKMNEISLPASLFFLWHLQSFYDILTEAQVWLLVLVSS